MTVEHLARELGVSVISVAAAMRKCGIMPYSRKDEVPLGYNLAIAKLIIAEKQKTIDRNAKRFYA
jgi:hypothetical protein